MFLLQRAIVLLLQFSILTFAQETSETVWAVFAFNVHGDSVPAILPQPRTLTPIGANDLYDVGSAFRDRYVMGASSTASLDSVVKGLAQHRLNTDEVRIYSGWDQDVQASALAFMQGFYPPITGGNDSFVYVDDTYLLANGSTASSPLNDYQYPRIYAAGASDPNSIYVSGQGDCEMHRKSELQYQDSPDAQTVSNDTAGFYSDLYDHAFEGLVEQTWVNYANAKDISEYLEYGYVHNASLQGSVSDSDLQRARVLANQYTFATNGNLSVSGKHEGDMIRAIAGRTLSRLILESFEENMETQGSSSKMTLLFGGPEPIVAFAALTQLASSMNSNFYGLPVPGASLVLEMFSMSSSSDSTYPDVSDMYVRFLFRNSSSTDEGFTQYPLFGQSPSLIDTPFLEFSAALGEIMLPSTEEWCNTCDGSSIFCVGSTVSGERHAKPRLSLAGAGAIGAAVTLGVVSLIGLIAWISGIGVYRKQKPLKAGGFKGGAKLDDDPDVAFTKPRSGLFEGAALGSGRQAAKSHERTGSWEMKNKRRSAEISQQHLDRHDEIEEATTNAEPVKVYEAV
ncbi:hypothetical protein PISL3812_01602 [Talaromyces islandicus]|uniref:Uncharacterized protein n=1 Tax=Talaromyces islandicus TaxID=28573 RepID=A0A0U1LMJ8_TALIS|nr:hypothetical protein PISL3812_01602 [Talaromyces islandicus]